MTTDWLEHYRKAAYEDGGRGPHAYDCWGLVREIRHKWLGLALLPSWGEVRHTNPAQFTRAYHVEARNMEKCEPEHGAIAACFRGRICVHAALVVNLEGRLCVLETSKQAGFRRTTIRALKSRYLTVVFYRDRTLSEQT